MNKPHPNKHIRDEQRIEDLENALARLLGSSYTLHLPNATRIRNEAIELLPEKKRPKG